MDGVVSVAGEAGVEIDTTGAGGAIVSWMYVMPTAEHPELFSAASVATP
jgi:hypothetical protein